MDNRTIPCFGITLWLLLAVIVAGCATSPPPVVKETSHAVRIWLKCPEKVQEGGYLHFSTSRGYENIRTFMAARTSVQYGRLTYDGSWLLLDEGAYAIINFERPPGLLELRVTDQAKSPFKGTIWTVVDTNVASIVHHAFDKTSISVLDLGKTDLSLVVGNDTHKLSVAVCAVDRSFQVQIEKSR